MKVSGDRTGFLYALKKRIAIRPRERFYAHASRVHPPSYYAEAWNLKITLNCLNYHNLEQSRLIRKIAVLKDISTDRV